MKSRLRKLLSAGIAALAVVSFAGVGMASAQGAGVIFAAANLLPPGGQIDPNAPSSDATFASGEAGTVIVTVDLRGRQANTRYVATIRDGACDGAVLYTLKDVQTDASGMGEASTQLKAAAEIGRWYVEVSPKGGAEAQSLCGAASQAIVSGPAAEPGGGQSGGQSGAPGMPRTGGPSDFLWQTGVLLLAALACLVVGRRLRTANGEQL